MTGASGVGKSSLMKDLLWQDLDAGRTAVAFDVVGATVPDTLERMREQALVGELRARSLPKPLTDFSRRRLAQRMSRIAVVDFADPQCPYRLNVLQASKTFSYRDVGLALASAVERIVEGDMAQMRQLLQLVTCLGMVASVAGGVVADMVELCCADTKTLEAFARRVQRRMEAGRIQVPVRRDILLTVFAEFFATTSARERRDLVASTLRVLTLILSDSVVERFLSARKCNLDLGAVMRGELSLLVHAPPSSRFAQAVLCGFMLDQLKTLALRRTAGEVRTAAQVICYIDEFQTVFTQQLAQEIAILRNKKLAFCLAHQTSSQPPFHTPEGCSLLQSVRDNCSTHVWFRLGQKDAEEVAGAVFRPRGNAMVQREYEDVSETESRSLSRSEGWSQSVGVSSALAEGVTFSKTLSLGRSGSVSYSETRGLQRTETSSLTLTRGESFCKAVSKSSGVSVSIGQTEVLVEGHGFSRSFSRSAGESSSISEGGSLGTWDGTSLALPAAAMDGASQPRLSSSSGTGTSSSWSSSLSSTLSETIGQVVSSVASLARGRSMSESTSRSTARTRSRTTSESRSEGQSIAEGLSLALGCVESFGRTLTEGRSEGRSLTHTRTQSLSESRTEGHSEGESRGRSVRRVTDYYSVDDEVTMRSYELMDLPARQAWVVIRGGSGAARRVLIRTRDVKQEHMTKLGTLEGAKLLAELCPVPEVEVEDELDLFERMAAQDRLGPFGSLTGDGDE